MPLGVKNGVPLPAGTTVWPVPLAAQLATEWCWLACAEMMGAWKNIALQQCQLAEQYVANASNCCVSTPPPKSCNGGGSAGSIQQLYTDHPCGFVPQPVDGQPAEGDLAVMLEHGPVQVFWTTPDLGHVALIIGVKPVVGGKFQFTLNDPWPVNSGQIRSVSYDQLLPTMPSGYPWSWECVWKCADGM
jgi:Papain-like cysteine protease AvrRpt2